MLNLKRQFYQVWIFVLELFQDVCEFFEEADCTDVPRHDVVVEVKIVVLQAFDLNEKNKLWMLSFSLCVGECVTETVLSNIVLTNNLQLLKSIPRELTNLAIGF